MSQVGNIEDMDDYNRAILGEYLHRNIMSVASTITLSDDSCQLCQRRLHIASHCLLVHTTVSSWLLCFPCKTKLPRISLGDAKLYMKYRNVAHVPPCMCGICAPYICILCRKPCYNRIDSNVTLDSICDNCYIDYYRALRDKWYTILRLDIVRDISRYLAQITLFG